MSVCFRLSWTSLNQNDIKCQSLKPTFIPVNHINLFLVTIERLKPSQNLDMDQSLMKTRRILMAMLLLEYDVDG